MTLANKCSKIILSIFVRRQLMKKNNKGISMITLVITIICILIFLGIAYRIGSRYITESIEEEKNVLISVLSSVVSRRQNDKYVDTRK